MKTINFKSVLAVALILLVASSCKQEVITLKQPTGSTPATPTKGNADFTTYVAIGNSLTAGFQAGALFTSGQNNSYPKILATQFSLAQGTTITFNQPDIGSVNGYNSSASASAGIPVGRYILFAADGNPNNAVPTPCNPGLPAPYNTAGPSFTDAAFYDRSGYNVATLNNFGAPGIILVQCLISDTGNPAKAAYNPYYARFASNPGTSTILTDAINRHPTFFTFDLGDNDVLGYATSGGDQSIKMTSEADFQTYFSQAIGGLMAGTTANGVVVTIPDVTSIPFFLAVGYNAIPLDQSTADQLMGASAFGGYNQVMGGISATLTANPGAFGLNSTQAAPIIAQIATRYVNYAAGEHNKILIKDETMIDMGPFFDGLLSANQITSDQRAGLEPYRQIRQAASTDLITLTAGAILGTTVGGNPLYVNGVSVPLDDKYVLIKQEVDSIKARTAAFNSIINTIAATPAYSARIAVADVNAAFNTLVASGFSVSDNITITPDFVPPTGAFSEDGVHPNSRGYAFFANVVIDAINAKSGWSTVIPKASLASYQGVGLPVTP